MNYMVSLDEPQSEITSFYKDILWRCGNDMPLKKTIVSGSRKWKIQKQKAFFLDRDGVINIDHGYVYQTEKLEFLETWKVIKKTI